MREGAATIAAPVAFATGPDMNFYEPISGIIERIARALERLGPRPIDTPDFDSGDAFVWHADSESFQPVRSYAEHYRLDASEDQLGREALEWARGRGSRSGRVAWQYIQDLAGRLGKPL
ncbi:MAG: DUF815 domain-containing protein [Methyloceanibacter sp.]